MKKKVKQKAKYSTRVQGLYSSKFQLVVKIEANRILMKWGNSKRFTRMHKLVEAAYSDDIYTLINRYKLKRISTGAGRLV
jgi:hypothetical protein